MADSKTESRFPALDEIDSDAVVRISSSELDESNNLSLFEREKAILPDGQFDELEDEEDDGEESKFEQDFPDILSQPNVMVGGTIVDPAGPAIAGIPSVSNPNNHSVSQVLSDAGEETEIIKEWRRRRDEAVAHRDKTSAEKKEKTVEEARVAIDDFYTNYNLTKDRNIKKTRTEADKFLDGRDDTTAGGTSWDRIAKLVDLSGHGTHGGAGDSGKSRFRDMLKGLTKDPDAPGASGV